MELNRLWLGFGWGEAGEAGEGMKIKLYVHSREGWMGERVWNMSLDT